MYYYNMYAPHRILRKYISRKVFNWADVKYGAEARGKVVNGALNEKQTEMLAQWSHWMTVKNRIYGKI